VQPSGSSPLEPGSIGVLAALAMAQAGDFVIPENNVLVHSSAPNLTRTIKCDIDIYNIGDQKYA